MLEKVAEDPLLIKESSKCLNCSQVENLLLKIYIESKERTEPNVTPISILNFIALDQYQVILGYACKY